MATVLSLGEAGQLFLGGGFPAAVNPEPVGGVGSDGFLEGAVDLGGDRFDRAQAAVGFADRNLWPHVEAPASNVHAATDRGVEGAVVAKGEDDRGGGGGTFASQERQPFAAVTRVLIGQEADHEVFAAHGFLQF